MYKDKYKDRRKLQRRKCLCIKTKTKTGENFKEESVYV